MILKLRAALEYPTFPINPWVFWVLEERSAAIVACRMIHGTQRVPQETFLKVHLLEVNHPQHSSRSGIVESCGSRPTPSPCSLFHNFACITMSQSARRWCQTLWIPLFDKGPGSWNPFNRTGGNLFSKLYDGKSEISYLGVASRKIPRLCGLPVLEGQFQDRSMR